MMMTPHLKRRRRRRRKNANPNKKSGFKVEQVRNGCHISLTSGSEGYRIGKGEGYADMEFAMMSSMGAVNQDTVVITTVHDCQVKDDLPDDLFGEHDLGVDIILTPTRMIKCENKRAKPKGIAWELLTREKFSQIPVLKILREREAAMGINVRLKEERDGCIDSSTALSPENHCDDRVSHSRKHTEKPGVESTDVRGSGRNVAGNENSTQAETHSQGRKDGSNSGSLGHDRRRDMDETGKDAGGPRTETRGQSASSGQRSKGHRPSSNRRRDLSGMFVWNQPSTGAK